MSARSAGMERRQAGWGGTPPPRLVAARGMSRTTPGLSVTAQARPSCGLVATSISGKVSPYSGWAGSMTSTVSAGPTVLPLWALYWDRFDVERVRHQQRELALEQVVH